MAPASEHLFPLECERALSELRMLRDELRARKRKEDRESGADAQEFTPEQRAAMEAWDPWAYFRATQVGVGGPSGHSGSSGAGGPVGNDPDKWQTEPWWQR